MRRTGVAVLTVVAMAAGTGAAEAAKKGTYRGTTAKGDPMALKVDGKDRVHSFSYAGVKLACSDGDTIDTPGGKERVRTKRQPRFDIASTRRWGIEARAEDGSFGWDVSGRFNAKGTKTRGKLSVFAIFNENGRQDANGSIRCEVEDLKFTLRRR